VTKGRWEVVPQSCTWTSIEVSPLLSNDIPRVLNGSWVKKWKVNNGCYHYEYFVYAMLATGDPLKNKIGFSTNQIKVGVAKGYNIDDERECDCTCYCSTKIPISINNNHQEN